MTASLHGRGVIVGLDWWGTNPHAMAARARRSGLNVRSSTIWNITRRSHRVAMQSRWLERAASAAAVSRLKGTFDWAIVTSPHRIADASLERLRSRSGHVIALIGDDPVGPRHVSDARWMGFDLVASADPAWLGRLSHLDVATKVEGWGATVLDLPEITQHPSVPSGILIVGAPHATRIKLAAQLAGRYPVTVQGPGWPKISGTLQRGAMPIDDTLSLALARRELIVNIHHEQFSVGLNPQFFDYAAMGIPQIVVRPVAPLMFELPFGTSDPENIDNVDLLSSARVVDANREISSVVRRSYLFEHSLERLLSA